jgi:hypothetical protein
MLSVRSRLREATFGKEVEARVRIEPLAYIETTQLIDCNNEQIQEIEEK